MERVAAVILAVVLLVGLALAGKGPVQLPEDPRLIPHEAQLTSTRTKADVDGDGVKEGLVLINALTGEQEPEQAAEVVLGIVGPGKDGALLWVRHVMRETGKPAHDGELMALDLDGNGSTEIVLTWDRSLTADRIDRWGEIYVTGTGGTPQKIWEGPWLVDSRLQADATDASREYFQREIDYSATRRAAGRAIVFRKVHRMIAGETLDPPRQIEERVDVALRRSSS